MIPYIPWPTSEARKKADLFWRQLIDVLLCLMQRHGRDEVFFLFFSLHDSCWEKVDCWSILFSIVRVAFVWEIPRRGTVGVVTSSTRPPSQLTSLDPAVGFHH